MSYSLRRQDGDDTTNWALTITFDLTESSVAELLAADVERYVRGIEARFNDAEYFERVRDYYEFAAKHEAPLDDEGFYAKTKAVAIHTS
jgi:hypothetical protein